MPAFKTQNADGEAVDRYGRFLHHPFVNKRTGKGYGSLVRTDGCMGEMTDRQVEWLLSQRVFWQREHDECKAEQTRLGREKNIEAARSYREYVSYCMKRLRATRLWIGMLVGDPALKDCPALDQDKWPVDLAPELDEVASDILLLEWARK